MKPERLDHLRRWLALHRDRVDVEQGQVWSADGRRAIGCATPLGYVRLSLSVRPRGGSVSYSVHEVIATAAGMDLSGDVEVNHKDGDKTNNAASNLEVVTHQANMQHAIRLGLWTSVCPFTKLTWAQVRAIRAAWTPGSAARQRLARQYGVTPSTIMDIVLEQTWTHDPGAQEGQAA